MEWVETVGKTVEEAVEVALEELGVDSKDAELVVVDEPRSGLLGFRKSEARVRARVRPTAPRPKRAQRSRRTGEHRAEQSGRPRNGAAPRKRGARAEEPAAQPESKSEAPETADSPAPTRSGSSRNRRGGQQRNRAPRSETPSAGDLEEAQMSIEQQQELVEEFVRGVVDRFGFQATTTSRVEDEYVFVDVQGPDLGLLVGPRGSTLDAFQELTRTIIQRRSDEHLARVILDVANFRAKRAEALQGFVQRVAQEVMDSAEAQALEPMSPADRKIVHDTAAEIDGVATTSEGVDPRRYVVVRPAEVEATSTDVAEDA